MEVVLEMRDLFNQQHASHESMWVPSYQSPEALQRLALMRVLETRLVLFDDRFGPSTNVAVLLQSFNWSNHYLEGAIEEVKQELTLDAIFRAEVMLVHTGDPD